VIGLLGGTFDPVHHGHLRIAIECCEVLGLSELRFIPCRQSPLRDMPHADADQRIAMLETALAGEPRFRLDRRELDRPAPSYTVDTLTELRAAVGATPLCLIVGMDAFLGLAAWHRWREVTRLAHLVVARRPGHAPEPQGELAEFAAQARCDSLVALRGKSGGSLFFLDTSRLDISATDLRARIAAGRSIRYLVPDSVAAIIHQHCLYRHH
jgi:nicotinate-nucleotide adenylyltransferase